MFLLKTRPKLDQILCICIYIYRSLCLSLSLSLSRSPTVVPFPPYISFPPRCPFSPHIPRLSRGSALSETVSLVSVRWSAHSQQLLKKHLSGGGNVLTLLTERTAKECQAVLSTWLADARYVVTLPLSPQALPTGKNISVNYFLQFLTGSSPENIPSELIW